MDDSDFISPSSLPSRSAAAATHSTLSRSKSTVSRPKKATIDSDCLLPGANSDKCFVCNKDLRHLNDVRKSLHVNGCLDGQEAKGKYVKEKEKWSRTVDCPICGEPLQPGPHRAAHAKRCGRKHEVPGSNLLNLMETQTKVAEVRMKNGLSHTKMKEPKLDVPKPSKLVGAPRTDFEEQMKLAMALSASVDSIDDDDLEVISEKRPSTSTSTSTVGHLRRPKDRRSFSFVELEPRDCRCSVFDQIQENFLKRFKIKKQDRLDDFRATILRREKRSANLLGDIHKCMQKLDRLERLADDLCRYGSTGGDVTILSLENEAILIHRFIIAARAPRLLNMIDERNCIPMRDYCASTLRCYVRFLYSSSIEWTEGERAHILKLAENFGPLELASLCRPLVTLPSQEGISSTETADVDKRDGCEKASPALEEAQTIAVEANEADETLHPSKNESCNSQFSSFIFNETECDGEGSSRLHQEGDAAISADNEGDAEGNVFSSEFLENMQEKRRVSEKSATKEKDSRIFDTLEESPIAKQLTTNAGNRSSGTAEEKAADSDDSSIIFVSETRSDESQEKKDAVGDDAFLEDTTNSGCELASTIVSAALEGKSVEDSGRKSPDIFAKGWDTDDDSADEKPTELTSSDSPRKDLGDDGEALKSDTVVEDVLGSVEVDKEGEKDAYNASAHCSSFLYQEPAPLDSFFLSPILSDTILREIDELAGSSRPSLEYPSTPKRRRERPPSPRSMSKADRHHFNESFSNMEDRSFSQLCSSQPSTSHAGVAEPQTKFPRMETIIQHCSTPLPEALRLKERLKELGSEVKVLKTTNITPIPDFAAMTDKQIKEELAKYGVRALGKKRGIALLKRIYETTHPIVDDFSPLTRITERKRRIPPMSLASRLNDIKERSEKADEGGPLETQRNHSNDDDDDILNKTFDGSDVLEESCADEVNTDVVIPKNLNDMQKVLVEWLEKEDNEELFNSFLSLHPVQFEEFADRLSRADSAVSSIPKKALMEILDRTHITFSLPQQAWKRRFQKKKK